jgi:hypothetical protein
VVPEASERSERPRRYPRSEVDLSQLVRQLTDETELDDLRVDLIFAAGPRAW